MLIQRFSYIGRPESERTTGNSRAVDLQHVSIAWGDTKVPVIRYTLEESERGRVGGVRKSFGRALVVVRHLGSGVGPNQ